MTILVSELKLYKSAVVNDTTANGGRASTDVVQSGAAQNVFPHVFKANRVQGLTRYRKIIYRNENDNDETGFGAQPFFHHPPGGDHYLWYHLGSHDDTQAAITGAERRFGSAALAFGAAAGQKTIQVTLKHIDQATMFVDGDQLIVSDKTTPGSALGNEEAHILNGVPTLSGLVLTLTTTETLANTYQGITSSVTSGPTAADMACSVSGWSETSAGDGSFDEAANPVSLDNIGTVYDVWTLTFTSATAFTVAGAAQGAVGTGSTAADCAPVNGSKSNKRFFTLAAAGWAGTWATGDTLIFTTNPAAINVWETLIVPANADPIGTGGFYSFLDIETT